MSEPFAALRKKHVEFLWTKRKKLKFENLKGFLAQKLVVKIFNLRNEIIVTIDANRQWNLKEEKNMALKTSHILLLFFFF